MTLHTDTPQRFDRAKEALADAVTIAPEGARAAVGPIVIERVGE